MPVWRKFIFLFRRGELDRDMQEELQSLSELAAPGELGNLTLAAENVRVEQGWSSLDNLLRDLRFGMRLALRNPGFSAVVMAILAIGIGANAAIFAQLEAVAWTRLPVHLPEELRSFAWMETSADDPSVTAVQDSFAYPEYESMRSGNTSFVELACWAPVNLNRPVVVPGFGRVEAQDVSGNFLPMLGVAPVLGRILTPEDDRSGETVAVISYGLWQRAFAGEATVLRKTVNVNGHPFTIAGVMPPGFFGIDPSTTPDVWVTIIADRAPELRGPRGAGVRVTGRLRGDVSDDRAKAEAEALLRPVPRPNSRGPQRVIVQDAAYGSGRLRNSTASYLGMMIAVTGAVLLIACANIAGLMLVRGAAREREFATRLAIGAPRGRLLRQLVTEGLLLAAGGGAAGIALARVLTPYFSALLPRLLQTPFGQAQKLSVAAGLDYRVLLFTGTVTLLACVLFSILPAVRATRSDIFSSMRATGAARYRFASSKAMVGLQVAVSVSLLIGAGLLIRTLINLRSVPLGYDPKGLLMIQLEPRLSGYTRERRNEFFENAVRRLEQLPSVVSASGSTISPIGGVVATLEATPGSADQLQFNSVGPKFFETWRWPVLAGRELEWSDRGKNRYALINQAFAKRYFDGRDPIGSVPRQDGDKTGWTIIGIVADSRSNPRDPARPLIFPAFWDVAPWMTLTVRTTGDPAGLVPAVRQVLTEIDPSVDILELNIPAEIRNASMNSEILFAGLLVTLGCLALLLCAIGLSGTLAYVVSRRFAEIGIRMALGARRRDVVRMVVHESMWPVATGIAAGVAAALPLTWFIRKMLFGVPRYDPASIVGATAVFLFAAALAALLPARRAALIDPMSALRHE